MTFLRKSVGIVATSPLISSQILEEMQLLANVDEAQNIASPTYGRMQTLIKWDRVSEGVRKLLNGKCFSVQLVYRGH